MPAMRTLRRTKARRTAAVAMQIAYSELMHAQAAMDDDWDDTPEDERRDDYLCRFCDGSGGDRWDDGVTPCVHCDGEGTEWWR